MLGTENTPSLFEAEMREMNTRRRQAMDWLKSLEKNLKAFRDVIQSGEVSKETIGQMARSFITSIKVYIEEAPEDLKGQFDKIKRDVEKEFNLKNNEP